MKVVMLTDVRGVGQRGTVVELSDGFALNSLIPQGKAVQATPDKIAEVQKRLASEKAQHDAKMASEIVAIRSLEGKTVSMKTKANEKGHLFKAIKKEDIAKELKLDADLVDLSGSLKTTGEHSVQISSGETKAIVKLLIEAA